MIEFCNERGFNFRIKENSEIQPYTYLYVLEKIISPLETYFLKNLFGINNFNKSFGDYELFDLLDRVGIFLERMWKDWAGLCFETCESLLLYVSQVIREALTANT